MARSDRLAQKGITKLQLNTLVISNLHYPAILLHDVTENFNTLEKQLNWGIKRVSSEQSTIDHQILKSNITSYGFGTSLKRKQNHTSEN